MILNCPFIKYSSFENMSFRNEMAFFVCVGQNSRTNSNIQLKFQIFELKFRFEGISIELWTSSKYLNIGLKRSNKKRSKRKNCCCLHSAGDREGWAKKGKAKWIIIIIKKGNKKRWCRLFSTHYEMLCIEWKEAARIHP